MHKIFDTSSDPNEEIKKIKNDGPTFLFLGSSGWPPVRRVSIILCEYTKIPKLQSLAASSLLKIVPEFKVFKSHVIFYPQCTVVNL